VYALAVLAATGAALAIYRGIVAGRAARSATRKLAAAVGGNYAARLSADDTPGCPELAFSVNALIEALETNRASAIRSELARKSLLSDISHDIRTPLTSIVGYSGALRDGLAASEAERAEFAAILDAKSRSLAAMVEDIFSLAKLDADEIPMRPESVDLAELTRSVVIDFLPAFAAAGIEPVVDIPENPCVVFADRLSVARILRNLVQNALQYGKNGKYLGVSLRADGGCLELTVEDRGPGIPVEDLERVFTRMYRRDAARNSSSGSGLGLAIVRALAEKNGASVSARSESGVSTAFIVRFPPSSAKA
jgi:signal transduction histidine kinase